MTSLPVYIIQVINNGVLLKKDHSSDQHNKCVILVLVKGWAGVLWPHNLGYTPRLLHVYNMCITCTACPAISSIS